MKEPQLVQDYLQDILEAMDKAEEFVGEAAKKIPAAIRRRFVDIPWKSLAGMRDKLIHDYVGVSLEAVWRTVKEDIPLVRPALVDMLEKMEAEEDGR
jgi:uncharacterized protein with HEPN domain